MILDYVVNMLVMAPVVRSPDGYQFSHPEETQTDPLQALSCKEVWMKCSWL
jgi:hypothetical protein